MPLYRRSDLHHQRPFSFRCQQHQVTTTSVPSNATGAGMTTDCRSSSSYNRPTSKFNSIDGQNNDGHLEAFRLRANLDAGLLSVIDNPRRQFISLSQQSGAQQNNYLHHSQPSTKHYKDTNNMYSGNNIGPTTSTANNLANNRHSSPSMIKLLHQRQLGLSECPRRRSSNPLTRADMCRISSRFLPNVQSERKEIRERLFVGVHSQDGKYFLSACKCHSNESIRLYNTSTDRFSLHSSFVGREFSFAIVDAAISPDNRCFVYSSWSDSLFMCSMDKSDRHEQLYMSPTQARFCIFSLRFTSSGDELLCGVSDSRIHIYNLQRRETTARVRAHTQDINAVAFADQSSNIFYSGSDDGLCKIWDRRCLDDREPGLRDSECRPVGVLAGHQHGITYIDSRNDGRYLITNSKDQTIKLWDIRKTSRVENSELLAIKNDWDYRSETANFRWYKTPRQPDNSLITFTGHDVRQTLIRCRFSPEFTTGQRFVYTGCSSGVVRIFDILTGHVIRSLDAHNGCVRDVSWHPYRNEIVSSSWDGTMIRWTHDSNNNEVRDDHYYFSTEFRRSRRIAELKKRRVDASQMRPFIQL